MVAYVIRVQIVIVVAMGLTHADMLAFARHLLLCRLVRVLLIIMHTVCRDVGICELAPTTWPTV